MYPVALHTFSLGDGSVCIRTHSGSDAVKHESDQNGAVNRVDIRLKPRRYIFPASWFVGEHTIEGAPVCNKMSRVAKVVVARLTVDAATNVVNLFSQTLEVLQTPFLDSGRNEGFRNFRARDLIMPSIKTVRVRWLLEIASHGYPAWHSV